MKQIIEQHMIVERGLVSYTLAVAEKVKGGFDVDIRNETSPNFLPGLFVCNMIKQEEIVEQEPIAKPKAGRPSKAALEKQALIEKLGVEATSTITKDVA